MQSLEEQKHDLEVKRHQDSVRLRNREIRLQAANLRQQKSARFTSIAVAAIAAASALAGGSIVAVIQGLNSREIEEKRFRATLSLEESKAQKSYDLEKLKADRVYDLENKKLESTLIAKAGEPKDILDVVARLRFWIKLELIPKRLEASLEQELNQDPTLLFASRDAALAQVTRAPLIPGMTLSDTEEMTVYRRRIQNRPSDTDALVYLGFALYKQNRLTEALIQLRRAVSINPSSQWGQYNLALAELANSDIAAGERTLQNLLRQSPQFAATIRRGKQFERFSEKSDYVRGILSELQK